MRFYSADKGIAAATCRFEIDIGDNVEQANRTDLKSIDLPVERSGVEPLVDVPHKQRRHGNPVRTDFQIVREQPSIGDRQITVQPDIIEQPARNLIDASYPQCLSIDRYHKAIGLAFRFPCDGHIFKSCGVKGKPPCAGRICDSWAGKRAIE